MGQGTFGLDVSFDARDRAGSAIPSCCRRSAGVPVLYTLDLGVLVLVLLVGFVPPSGCVARFFMMPLTSPHS